MHYDSLETRSADQRAADIASALPRQIARAQATAGAALQLTEIDAAHIADVDALSQIPVLRKADLVAAQAQVTPFGGYTSRAAQHFSHLFQSPGPIYEPGMATDDWWRLARFLVASGIGQGDIIQNCFSYHLTPAGSMFENAARSVKAAVVPAGIGQTELQVQAAAHLGVSAYAGTPDYLKILLEAADEQGVDLSRITRAVVGGGALFPSLRDYYQQRGVTCRQCYATADLGNIAYETDALEGMVVDDGVIVEIVTPGTGDPVPEGDVGEVVVTSLNADYPLVRFATGDLSAVLPGLSPCGRTNTRIKGWMGRADQTTKVKGMFVRPEQVATLVQACNGVSKARVSVSRVDQKDQMTVQFEGDSNDITSLQAAVKAHLKLSGDVSVCATGTLPNDGKVIDDLRAYDT